MKRRFGHCSSNLTVAEGEWDPLPIAKEDGYRGGPWFIKTSAPYHKLFKKAVLVRRDTESIIRSATRSGMLHGDIERGVLFHQLTLDSLDWPEIYPDEIVKGDYSSLGRAFEFCGIEMDPERVSSVIDGELWTATES